MLGFIASILGFFGSIGSAIGDVVSYFTKQANIKEGEQIQAQAGTAQAAKTETAIAQAEVDAPETAPEVEKSLDNGTF